MRKLLFPVDKRINARLLHEELGNEAGYIGLASHRNAVTLAVSEDVSGSEQFKVIIDAHDASLKSAEEEELDALRGQISALRQSVGDVDELTAGQAITAIKLLFKVLKVHDLI